MILHDILKKSSLKAAELCNEHKLKISRFSVKYAGMAITLVPGSANVMGTKADFKYPTFVISAQILESQEVDCLSNSRTYQFSQKIHFASFARQLVCWAKKQNGIVAETANNLKFIKQGMEPVFENFNIEESVAITWLLFFDEVFSGKYPHLKHLTKISEDGKTAKKAAAKTSAKKDNIVKHSNIPMFGGFLAVFNKDHVAIRRESGNYRFCVKIAPTEDEKVMSFKIVEKSTKKQLTAFNASKKELFAAIGYYLVNKISSNTNPEVEQAVDLFVGKYDKPKFELFADEEGKELDLNENLVYVLALFTKHWSLLKMAQHA
jgi:hypothetical protein